MCIAHVDIAILCSSGFFFFFCHIVVIVDSVVIPLVPRALPLLYVCSLPKWFGRDGAQSGTGRLVLHRRRGSGAVFPVQRDGGGLAAGWLSYWETPAAVAILQLHPEPPVHRQPAVVLALGLLAAPHRPRHPGKSITGFNSDGILAAGLLWRTVQRIFRNCCFILTEIKPADALKYKASVTLDPREISVASPQRPKTNSSLIKDFLVNLILE